MDGRIAWCSRPNGEPPDKARLRSGVTFDVERAELSDWTSFAHDSDRAEREAGRNRR